MNNPKFIGTIGWDDVAKTICNNPWEPIAFDWSPFPLLGRDAFHLWRRPRYITKCTTLQIDVFRQDYINGTVVIDIDHYIAKMGQNSYSVYKYPPTPYHHLKPADAIITQIPPAWQSYLKKVTKGDIFL